MGRNTSSILGGLVRAAFSDGRRWSAVAALAFSLAAPQYGPSAEAAEPGRAASNSSLKWRPASTRSAPAVPSRADEPAPQPETPPRPDEGPGLIDADRAARPLEPEATDDDGGTRSMLRYEPAAGASVSNGTAPPWPRRDNSIRLTQATQPLKPMSDPLLTPFQEDELKKDLDRLGTPAQGAPATPRPVPGTTQQTAPRPLEPASPSIAPVVPSAPAPLPSTGQLAIGGGGFQEERCPELSELKKIGAITNNVTAQPGELPRECYFDTSVLSPSNRPWMATTYMWKASGLCHKPLYFEQVALERYGHSTGPLTQPIVDGAHFFLTLPVLPYKMGVEAPWECKYALGYYRPGSCAPYIIPPVPLSARGAALEAAAAATLVYTLP